MAFATVQAFWMDMCNPKKFVIVRLQVMQAFESKVRFHRHFRPAAEGS